MKRFILNIIYLSIPFLIWGAAIVIIDPFNYFNLGLFDKSTRKNAEDLNQLMYRTIDYVHNPCQNLLIGDSRTELLPIGMIEQISKQRYKKLNTSAAKLNEVFDLFYLANARQPVKRVVIGINFNMFNKYGYQDRISGLKRVLNNPLMYVFNADVADAAWVNARYIVTKRNIDFKPPMTVDEFWKWSIDVKASDWYGKYAFPDALYKQLLDFDKFTKDHGIEVIFIIVPHNNEFHNRLVHFGLEGEEKRFKAIMAKLNAKVYDFDYLNAITIDRNNFKDPVHYNERTGALMVNEIWNNKPLIGRRLNHLPDSSLNNTGNKK